MKIGILAVQGAFAEHEQMLEQLGAEYIELRKGEDVRQSYDGLILPGGESTVQGKLMRELDMFDTIQSQIKNGMPVLATCAGAILLAQQLSNDAAIHLATLPPGCAPPMLTEDSLIVFPLMNRSKESVHFRCVLSAHRILKKHWTTRRYLQKWTVIS